MTLWKRSALASSGRPLAAFFGYSFMSIFLDLTPIQLLRFDLKHGDAELVAMLEGAPPVDLERCGIFRTAMAKFQKQAGCIFVQGSFRSRFEVCSCLASSSRQMMKR